MPGIRATETGANAASANRSGRRSSAVVRAKVSRASGPTTAFEDRVVVSSSTEANPGRRSAAASSASRTVPVDSGGVDRQHAAGG